MVIQLGRLSPLFIRTIIHEEHFWYSWKQRAREEPISCLVCSIICEGAWEKGLIGSHNQIHFLGTLRYDKCTGG